MGLYMTHCHDMIILDFDSQIQLLSRIKFLTRFSSNLIEITGELGSGKTCLSQRYLSNWANEPSQSLLICNPHQQDGQHRAIILRQIVCDGVFNEQHSILHSLEYMLDGRDVHALIVIDNAQILSASVIAELLVLVTEAQQHNNWQINVLLFSLLSQSNKYLYKIPYGDVGKPIELEISPLTDSEREMFIDKMMVNRELDMEQQQGLKQRAALLPPLPGALKRLELQETPKMKEKKHYSLFAIILLALLLLVLGISIAWWRLNPALKSEQNTITNITPNIVKEFSEIPVEEDTEMRNLSVDEANVRDVDRNLIPKVMNDTVSLPDKPTVEGMTVGRRDEYRRIIVPDHIVNAIIDKQSVVGYDTSAVNLPITAQFTPQEEVHVTHGVSDKRIKPNVFQSDTSNTPSLTENRSTKELVLSHTILLMIPDSRYAIQLAAVQSKATVHNFLQQYEIKDRAMIYETVRNGEIWFIVLIGDYSSVNEARQAEMQLSENVQRLNPWIKSFSQIHREINLIK
ncbi:SPOR domain-containing protein [Candidatus Enterovibrio escicola]|uniref:SPOR domain-containing protein n=2 Tax=Candidatus Enterovibrio escicola TaxID=1927127 RepID=UPI001CC27E15|nr:SPOR domain-containing protein [Candidatus Enterovibrio escacola]